MNIYCIQYSCSMRWAIEFSEEIRTWYGGLPPAGKAAIDRRLERLANEGSILRMPHSRSLSVHSSEIRFTWGNKVYRIKYVIDPIRRTITLTTISEPIESEQARILRARRARQARKGMRRPRLGAETGGLSL